MSALSRNPRVEEFFRGLKSAVTRVLLLDYDGTLAPFQSDRDSAFPYPGVREVLNEIQQQGSTRLVLVSGRDAHAVLRLLQPDRSPEIWGAHGRERMFPDGTYHIESLDPRQQQGIQQARQWIEDRGLADKLEEKQASIAFHTRGMEPTAAEKLGSQVSSAWDKTASESSLEIHRFDGGIELRAPGIDKGTAVRDILNECDRPTAAAYLGDDLTDEDGFEALKGRGLTVLVRAEPRETAADVRIEPPDELLEFLNLWRIACEGAS